MPERRFPPPWSAEVQPNHYVRPRRQQTATCLRLLRERTRSAISSEIAFQGRGAADRREHCKAARPFASLKTTGPPSSAPDGPFVADEWLELLWLFQLPMMLMTGLPTD
jgi:hypothetical protein